MSDELDVLLDKIDDPALRADIADHVRRLRSKRTFGLVFESHLPEQVRLPGHKVRRGVLAARRDNDDEGARTVLRVADGKAELATADGTTETVPVDDLVVVAEFGQPIYPGLRHLGGVHRGGNKPAHVVIKGENHHALELLRFTHAGKVDAIYIDPPYNTGARDWKYNNDYVDDNDAYRHSKWLAFMERRLQVAKELLNPARSVLIVAIGDEEAHRLGLLLEQLFPDTTAQLVTSVVNPRGRYTSGRFLRTAEYFFCLTFGDMEVHGADDPDYDEGKPVPWRTLRRSDIESRRGSKKGGTSQFYPIYVNVERGTIEVLGSPLPHDVDRGDIETPPGCVAVFPVRDDGTEMNWGLTTASLNELLKQGFVRVGRATPAKPQKYEISYLTSGRVDDVLSGRARVVGKESDGAVIARYVEAKKKMPSNVWMIPSHNAEVGGTNLLKSIFGDKRFDYPKSLYAVEDMLWHFLQESRGAVVLDFFGGSGSTAHAVMRLNRRDAGQRQCISVTNNEVGVGDDERMRASGLRPGDPDWESFGIFEHITRPRIEAAITGLTPAGDPIKGDYKFTDEFSISEGFEENVEFFELAYLDAEEVELDMAFEGVAPLLWLRAGGVGPIIEESVDSAGRRKPYTTTDQYGVLFNSDRWRGFVDQFPESARTAFVVTDSVQDFAGIAAELPPGLDVVRLYENYLATFAINERR